MSASGLCTPQRYPDWWCEKTALYRLTGCACFGVSSGFDGCRFAIGLRNSHDKSFRLRFTVGLSTFVCESLALHGDHTPLNVIFSCKQALSPPAHCPHETHLDGPSV
jgi:hypothetical protein